MSTSLPSNSPTADESASVSDEYVLWIVNGGQSYVCQYGTTKDHPLRTCPDKDHPLRTCPDKDLIGDYCNMHTCGCEDKTQPDDRCHNPKANGSCWCSHHMQVNPKCPEPGCGRYVIVMDGKHVCPECRFLPKNQETTTKGWCMKCDKAEKECTCPSCKDHVDLL